MTRTSLKKYAVLDDSRFSYGKMAQEIVQSMQDAGSTSLDLSKAYMNIPEIPGLSIFYPPSPKGISIGMSPDKIVKPRLDALNTGNAPLTTLKGSNTMYRYFYVYERANGQIDGNLVLNLGPTHPVVVGAFKNLAHRGQQGRNMFLHAPVGTTSNITGTSQFGFVLKRGLEVILSTDDTQLPVGTELATAPEETISIALSANNTVDVVCKAVKSAKVPTASPIAVGESFSLSLQSQYAWDLSAGILLSTKIAETSAEESTMLGLPDGATLKWVAVLIDPSNADGYVQVTENNNPNMFSTSISLSKYTKRVYNVTTSTEANPIVEYRVLPGGSWNSVDAAVISNLTGSDAGSLEFRVHLTDKQHRFYGISFTVDEGEDFPSLGTQPQPQLPALAPFDWKAPALEYRAVSYGQFVGRHSMMPIGMGGVRAFTIYGNEVSVYRYGNCLCLPSNNPHVIYWTVSAGSNMPMSTGPNPAQAGAVMGYWGAAEKYTNLRNVVQPAFGIKIGGVDFSSQMVDFQSGSVTIAGPASVFESVPTTVQAIEISGQSQPIFTGKVVRTTSKPFANGRVVSFNLMTNSEYFDADLSRVDLSNETLPISEDSYIKRILEQSGYSGELYMAPGIEWRNLDFWQAPLPIGPGTELAEVESRYRNTQNTSTLATVKTVLQANMLELFDLPNGELLVDTIIPSPNTSLVNLLKNAAVVYCAADGNYVNDPRLSISNISLALDEGFAETEVEGFSNEVELYIGKGLANFVANGNQNNFLDRTVGGYESSSIWELLPASAYPFPFQVMENGKLRHEPFPLEWFEQAQVSANSSAVEAERIYQSDGFMGGGNKNVVYKDLFILSGEQAAQRWPDRRDAFQEFVDTFMPALEKEGESKYSTPADRMNNSRLAVGFSAKVEGDYISKATFRFKVNVGRPSEAQLNITPLTGRFDERWAPEWFPPIVAAQMVQTLKDMKPRNTRKITNQMIARIGSQYAVQKPSYADGRIPLSEYDNNWTTSANQLATWLTLRDLLKTRQVEVSLAGAHSCLPNQFIFIARRPAAGVGKPYTHVDVLLTLEPGRPDARVGSEAWTRLSCAYIGHVLNNEAYYDFPIGWGAAWHQ